MKPKMFQYPDKFHVMGGHYDREKERPNVLLVMTIDGTDYAVPFNTPEDVDQFIANLRNSQARLWPNHEPDTDMPAQMDKLTRYDENGEEVRGYNWEEDGE